MADREEVEKLAPKQEIALSLAKLWRQHFGKSPANWRRKNKLSGRAAEEVWAWVAIGDHILANFVSKEEHELILKELKEWRSGIRAHA